MRDLYFECASGISGDMAVAALLDLGADKNLLISGLESLKLNGVEIKIERIKKSGIACLDFEVKTSEDNLDHDMNYLYGHLNNPPSDCNFRHHDSNHHEHSGHHHNGEVHHHACESVNQNQNEHNNHSEGNCEQNHLHSSEQNHPHHHIAHSHTHRTLNEIISIIDSAQISEAAKKLAKKIFDILAQGECAAHGHSKEQLHFHEVGALDSIVDVVAFAICFTNLQVHKVFVPVVFEGTGTVNTQHGVLPVPVPAVVNIARDFNLNLSLSHEQGEFITPTGAAILAAIKTDEILPKTFSINKIGIGAGKREYKRLNVLRVFEIEENITANQTQFSSQNSTSDEIIKIEANIDDCSPEILSYTMEQLFAANAKDVFFVPCYMKKNRPATILTVLASECDCEKIEEIIFRETSTIGVRKVRMLRSCLERAIINCSTKFGDVAIKVVSANGEKKYFPEYESVAALAKKNNVPFYEVYNEALKSV